MLSTLKLSFGIKHGVLTHVRDVASGATCGCNCPACGENLIAKKGSSRQHHFAHINNSECKHGVETSLHLAAKKILEQKMEISLPEVEVWFYSPRASFILSSEKTYKLDKVVLKTELGKLFLMFWPIYQARKYLKWYIADTHFRLMIVLFQHAHLMADHMLMLPMIVMDVKDC